MFEPWIGSRYEEGLRSGGKRLLMLGESHHADEYPVGATVPSMTKDVMAEYALGERGGWRLTFDRAAWALSGKRRAELHRDDRRGEMDVWEDTAFYNYVPHVAVPYSQMRPKTASFVAGKEPFERLIADHHPQIIVVWGYRLFPWVIQNHYGAHLDKPWEFKGEWVDIPGEEPLRLVRMKHPAMSFNSEKWADVIQWAVAEPL